MNSDGALLERNHLNTHDRGLLLRYDAIIGNQNNKYNRWIGNGSNVEAQFEGRDPSDQQDVFFVTQSRFRIHTPNTTTDFWPDPRLFGNVADQGQWFVSGEPASVQCIASAFWGGGEEAFASLTEADLRVMDETFEPVKGYAAGSWEAALRLYLRLSQYPELRPGDSGPAQWYAAQEENATGELGSLYHAILSLSRFSGQEQAGLDDAATTQQVAAQAVIDLDEQMADSLDNPVLLEQLIAERQQLETTLAAAVAAHQELLGNLRNARLSAAQQLLEDLASVGTTEAYETDFKTVCRILLDTYTDENGLSETNRQTLSDIAHQCRYEGGFAVLQARASLGEEWDWSAYDTCPDTTEERASRHAGKETAVTLLYPNPAKDATLLDLGRTVAAGRATLRDLSGRALQEWPLDGQRQVWLRWGGKLPAGLYLLEVSADQTAPQVLKLVLDRN